jgi:NAD(P)-dependent dehydrogenase (short-subunit alcohol dehydrogenase family)
VAVLDRAVEEEVEAARWIPTDVTDEEQARGAVADVLDSTGRIDVLVNCAGVIGPVAPAQLIPLAEWRRTIEVNLTGTFVMCAAVLPALLARGEGRIVNFASAAGVENQAGQAAYNASKAGVISLTKTLAREVHRAGVRVNAVCPAAVSTPLLDEFLDQELPSQEAELVANQRAHRAEIDAGLTWAPDEVMDLVVFLASPAGSHVSGQFVRMATKAEPGVYH